MAIAPNFNWVPFYEAFAQKLLTYKDNRPELLDRIYETIASVGAQEQFRTFRDKETPKGKKTPFKDIDPFTIYSLFNRLFPDDSVFTGKDTPTVVGRRTMARCLAQAIGVKEPLPDNANFSGIPCVPPTGAFFIPYAHERKERNKKAIDFHWRLLEIANELPDNQNLESDFIKAFNDSLEIKHVGQVKLTTGLFWAFPNYFPPYDQFTTQYAAQEFGIDIPKNFSGSTYIEFRESFLKKLDSSSSIFDITWEAWYREQQNTPQPEPEAETDTKTSKKPKSRRAIQKYSVKNIIKEGCFIPKGKIQDILESWELKRNLILQGPPGTGKTWLARRLAYALIGNTDETKVNSVQFHPNMSYEDFVRGYRPNPDGKLEAVSGIFMETAKNAAADPKSKYAIVIEEINRGNPAMIFGELLTLMEADKRGEDNAIDLTYPDDTGNKSFFIPPNLYIIGTMNIADRSLAMVDLALRRRFAFYDLKPELGRTWLQWVKDHGVSNEIAEGIQERMQGLNQAIAQSPALGEQYQIGHSSVTPATAFGNDADTRHWFKQVAETEIYPLLQEYWFDSPQELDEAWDDFTAPSGPAFPNGVLG